MCDNFRSKELERLRKIEPIPFVGINENNKFDHVKIKTSLDNNTKIDNHNEIAIRLLEEISSDLLEAYNTNDVDEKDRYLDNSKVKLDTIIQFYKIR